MAGFAPSTYGRFCGVHRGFHPGKDARALALERVAVRCPGDGTPNDQLSRGDVSGANPMPHFLPHGESITFQGEAIEQTWCEVIGPSKDHRVGGEIVEEPALVSSHLGERDDRIDDIEGTRL